MDKGGNTARILVIEDNPTNLQLVVYLLEAFGHQVGGAKEGAEGIEMARQQRPDLILLDIHMPRMDGYEVAHRLRDDPACRHIPIIAVTALAMVGDKEKLLAAGFNGYISKPIDPETFAARVQEFLGVPQSERSAGRETTEIAATTQLPPRGKSRGVFLFVDNSATNLQLARSILTPQGYTVLTASSVNEGFEIARREKPDLIVSDIHMPQRDGYDFIDLLQASSELRCIPFVFLSSSVLSSREWDNAVAHGAVKLLTRPIDAQTLLDELKACVRLQ